MTANAGTLTGTEEVAVTRNGQGLVTTAATIAGVAAATETAEITAAVAAEAAARATAIGIAVAAEAVLRAAGDNTPAIVTAVPVTTDTITMVAGEKLLFVNPAGTIAALTIKLPPSPVAGQIVEIGFGQIVTTLTLQDSAAGAIATTAGAVGVAQQYRFIGAAWVKWR